VKVWYSTGFAFLAHHVLGEPWQRPDNQPPERIMHAYNEPEPNGWC
jgi:hypothetical protein